MESIIKNGIIDSLQVTAGIFDAQNAAPMIRNITLLNSWTNKLVLEYNISYLEYLLVISQFLTQYN